jgi:hypothetical protein
MYKKMHGIENGNGLRFVFSRISHFLPPAQRECDWINWIADSVNRLYNPDESAGLHEMPVAYEAYLQQFPCGKTAVSVQ